MHMATVYGAAVLLNRFRDRLKGNVRFIFQPAEELPPGGARPMIESGALDGVGAILGLHVDPALPTGRISIRDGVTMASVTDFDLIVSGKAGHAARPHTAIDAIATAAEMVDSIQKIVAREVDPIAPVAITFGQIEGGRARNVIADEVRLVGTARTLSETAAKKVAKQIKRTAEGIAKARGAKVEMRLIADYPVLKNDPRVNRLIARNAEKLIGRTRIEQTDQGLGGEDFACYLEKVPGAMFRLGTMNKKIKADQPWHSAHFIADENALPIGTALLTAAVIDYLEGGF
jgi:amidohydrolase